MDSFSELNLSRQLQYALTDLNLDKPTPIQTKAYPVILSGKDMVGIAQTGTGKTFAYLLPILKDLKFSKQKNPRVLILVPTRELVIQVTEEIEKLGKYINIRAEGVYGGVNINTQRQVLAAGTDIVVATPGRLYDLVLDQALKLKSIKKLVIDEVDVMLDLGFRYQLNNIFELLPERRQNIMFSATMTEDVDALIKDNFKDHKTVSIAVSGTPLDNISQSCYAVPNFYTKVNLLVQITKDKELFNKLLVFVKNKRSADRLFEILEEKKVGQVAVIHSNKTQNYRIRSIEDFNKGKTRILVTTDVMARGLHIEQISHVINFDTPAFPENYMHRIGRTGRAEQEGTSILFYTEKEEPYKDSIESLMNMKIKTFDLPDEVEISDKLIPEEQPRIIEPDSGKKLRDPLLNSGFHEKKEKNKKENQGGSYKRNLARKYKKPKTRGDKIYNKRKKRK